MNEQRSTPLPDFPPQRPTLVLATLTDSKHAFALLLLGVALASLIYFWVGNTLITSAYNGESFGFLNDAIAAHRESRPWGTLEHYLTLGRLAFSRLLLVFVAIVLAILAILRRRDVLATIGRFFGATADPLNLALFRIVLFYTILETVDVSQLATFAQLPATLRAAPLGFEWFLEVLGTSASWPTIFGTALTLSSFTALVGLFTRTSATVTTVLALFVLGTPNFFGKIDHNHHHLVWFSAVLATSRCGAALSCDALIAAWQRANRGDTHPPAAALEFALPLRVVMLLMGTSYFFAGFWKLWESGVDWVITDNLKYIMYQKWFDLGGFVPPFRIDQYPLLCKFGALATIGFEVSIVFVMFSDRLRPLIPVGGAFLHTMTDVFMRISFKELLRCHVVFFDWSAILHRVGAWLFRTECRIVYDDASIALRRFIAIARAVDVFGRTAFERRVEAVPRGHHSPSGEDWPRLTDSLHAVIGERTVTGWVALRNLAARIPLLGPLLPLLLPLLYIWPPDETRQLSQPMRFPEHGGAKLATAHQRRLRTLVMTSVTGMIIFSGNFIASALRHDGWPFTVYPTFAGQAGPESQAVELVVVDDYGAVIESKSTLDAVMPRHRFFGQMGLILPAVQTRDAAERLAALGELWRQSDPGIRHARYIRLYRVTVSTVPELASANPLRRELLLEEAF